MLQRSAPLVRLLAGRRSAILLPAGPELLVALAASDGRGALVLDPKSSPAAIARSLKAFPAGAVFTTRALARRLPSDAPVVLLDDAPRSATVRADGLAGTHAAVIDLGSHHGLSLEGQRDVDGAAEECVCFPSADDPPVGSALTGPIVVSHRVLLADARAMAARLGLTPLDVLVTALPFTDHDTHASVALAGLLRGAHWRPGVPTGDSDATLLVATAPVLAAFARRVAIRDTARLRAAWCVGEPVGQAARQRFEKKTGVSVQTLRSSVLGPRSARPRSGFG